MHMGRTITHCLQVVCGTQEGVLAVFNWGEWGDVSDRFPGHPASVDTVVPLTEVCVCAIYGYTHACMYCTALPPVAKGDAS
jgi:hypothetical protein